MFYMRQLVKINNNVNEYTSRHGGPQWESKAGLFLMDQFMAIWLDDLWILTRVVVINNKIK